MPCTSITSFQDNWETNKTAKTQKNKILNYLQMRSPLSSYDLQREQFSTTWQLSFKDRKSYAPPDWTPQRDAITLNVPQPHVYCLSRHISEHKSLFRKAITEVGWPAENRTSHILVLFSGAENRIRLDLKLGVSRTLFLPPSCSVYIYPSAMCRGSLWNVWPDLLTHQRLGWGRRTKFEAMRHTFQGDGVWGASFCVYASCARSCFAPRLGYCESATQRWRISGATTCFLFCVERRSMGNGKDVSVANRRRGVDVAASTSPLWWLRNTPLVNSCRRPPPHNMLPMCRVRNCGFSASREGIRRAHTKHMRRIVVGKDGVWG